MIAGALVQDQRHVLDDSQEAVIHYGDSHDLADPITVLQKRVDSGNAKLNYVPSRGYLDSVLRELKVPISSQTLVFSKTSSQAHFTSPKSPRALYFNDDVYVGFAHGSPNLDLVAIDPKKGPILFTIDQKNRAKAIFKRRDDCAIACHIGPRTLNVPGLILRSAHTAPDGRPLSQIDDFVPGHNNPLAQRWAGWYVTGTHGKDQHLGNATVPDRAAIPKFDKTPGSNVVSLKGRVEAKYLSPHSDTVALLVLDHAVRMQNHITQAHHEALYAAHERSMLKDKSLDWSQKRIAAAGEALLAYMLFRDEAPLNGPIKGTSAFEREFSSLGPRDKKGRSLRDFDLKTRVFKYPCSYLIYSPSFDALPFEMKDYLYRRLREILSGQDQSLLYRGMAATDREAVLDILLDTKPNLLGSKLAKD